VKRAVSARLSKATSGLTISFDKWTANSKVLDLLGIMVHYLDDDYKRRAVVLGLRKTLASHAVTDGATTGSSVPRQVAVHRYGNEGALLASDYNSDAITPFHGLWLFVLRLV
jgi:hypothetical protein